MFAQLCTDLPWTQHLSEVWACAKPTNGLRRSRYETEDPRRCAAPVGTAPTKRLHCGDQIIMAANALAAYQADTAAGKDALLICDITEMSDALNQRLHHDTVAAGVPTVTGARGYGSVSPVAPVSTASPIPGCRGELCGTGAGRPRG
jgi:hypothetical protein